MNTLVKSIYYGMIYTKSVLQKVCKVLNLFLQGYSLLQMQSFILMKSTKIFRLENVFEKLFAQAGSITGTTQKSQEIINNLEIKQKRLLHGVF